MPNKNGYILALDVGEKRIGLALASSVAKLPQPYKTIAHTDSVWDELSAIVMHEKIDTLVVGLPRGLQGGETEQTKYVRDFTRHLEQKLQLEIVYQDEALTSKKAEAELRARPKTYARADIDSLAATYILEDYFQNSGRMTQ